MLLHPLNGSYLGEVSGFLYKEGGYHGHRYHGRDVGEPCIEAEDLDDIPEDGAAEAGDGEPNSEVQPEGLIQLLLIDAVGQYALDYYGLRHESDEEQQGGEAQVAGYNG